MGGALFWANTRFSGRRRILLSNIHLLTYNSDHIVELSYQGRQNLQDK